MNTSNITNYKPKDFAELLGVSVKTLQRWDREGILEANRTPTDRRYYTYDQYLQFKGIKTEKDNRQTVIYARVSTRNQKEDLQNQWGREPTVGELSERLGVEQEELVMALDAGGDVESLHKPIYQKDGQEIRLMDKLEEKSEEHEQVLNHIVLTELLGVLNQDEKRLIYLRYFAEQTQSQVGRELGISQVQVSRMEKKILGQLKNAYFHGKPTY